MKAQIQIKTLLLGLLLCLGISCDPDLVDEDPLGPTEATFFNNADEFRSVLVGAYAAYFDWYHFSAPSFSFGNYPTATFLLPGDDLTIRDGIRNEVELFDGSLNPTQNRVSFIYDTCYKAISRANVVIEKTQTLDLSGLDGASEIARMEGEALFLRGYAYFTLFKMFGSVPIITERILDRAGTNTPKSTANEVVSQAIADAQAAIPSLPDSWDAVNAGRVTKNSARGLLAKALVFRANFNGDDSADMQAAIAAFNTMTTVLVPDFIDNFNAFTENNDEAVFEFQAGIASNANNLILHNDGPWRGVENQSVYRGFAMEPGGPGFNDASSKFFITEKLLTAYGTDPRISVFLNSDDGNGGLIFQKYNKPDGVNELTAFHGGSANNQRLLRHAGIQLMVAEAELKTGNTSGAINHLNAVRTRARNWGSTSGFGDGIVPANYDTGESDPNTIMQWIMDERWIELAGEGHRWDDLKRWHASGDVDLTGWDGSVDNFSTILASPVQFDVNKHLLFPIPQNELDRNTEVTENNPGY